MTFERVSGITHFLESDSTVEHFREASDNLLPCVTSDPHMFSSVIFQKEKESIFLEK